MVSCRVWRVMAGVSVLMVAACGGGDGGTGPTENGPASIAVASGDGQTSRVNTALSTAPTVIVKDGAGNAVASATVTFAVEAGGGQLAGTTATTNASGIATMPVWTLGPAVGANSVAASVNGVAQPARISATARLPYWTVAVYMAADNNLATDGVDDIDEMEAASVNPEIQTVIQAEFSPTTLGQYGCTPQLCTNRPNYNTFRYAITGQGTPTLGPNGPTTDLGNLNMVDPGTLASFLTWAKTTYPAEHTMLVLWNHGNGYQGFLADETSAPGQMMSHAQLRTALTQAGTTLDVADFDMCLMGGYETLATLQGHARYAVFSEETVPGEGLPYTEVFAALNATPTADAKTVAMMVADKFGAYYGAKTNASTTHSVYDVAGYGDFESALNTLAGTLTTNVGTYNAALTTSAMGSQRYEIAAMTDLTNFLDSLRANTSDATLWQQIDAVKSSAGGIRLKNFYHNAAGAGAGLAGANDVSRSTGLSILMPTQSTAGGLPSSGTGSLANYQADFAGKGWTAFLTAFLASSTPYAVTDQGEVNRFEFYLVWPSTLYGTQGDIDLWILEPSGNLYIPYLGVVTPNGTLTGDSWVTGAPFEGYFTNRYLQNGTYKVYASLYADPKNTQPAVDIASRTTQASDFTWLYGASAPHLSLATSWLNDPSASFASIEAGAYTDLVWMSYFTVGVAPMMAQRALGATRPTLTGAALSPMAMALTRAPTSAQLATARQAALARREGLDLNRFRRDHGLRSTAQPHRAPLHLEIQ